MSPMATDRLGPPPKAAPHPEAVSHISRSGLFYREIGTDLYVDYKGCLGMARLPFTIGGKSFTSSYTSVMKRSVLACVSP